MSGGVVRLRIGEVALVMSPATARRVVEVLSEADPMNGSDRAPSGVSGGCAITDAYAFVERRVLEGAADEA